MTLRPELARLGDDRLARHLLTRGDVALPDPPSVTGAALANAARVLDGRFRLVGEEYRLPDGFSWKPNPSADKEWQIAHHKHYFLPDLLTAYDVTGDDDYLRTWQRLLASWLDEMGSGFVSLSDAQVEALRLQDWVASYLLLRRVPWRDRVDSGLMRRWVERIGEEAAYVSTHLKPVRNHRTFQLYSVFLVGVLFPELADGRHLVDLGRHELTANLLTDLLPDGVHVEMSTHYHQLVAETAVAFVDLARRNRIELEPVLLERVHRALRYSMWLQWPDGDIPLVGDSDNGDHRELLRKGGELYDDPELLWAGTLGADGTPPARPSTHFDSSGYFVLGDGWGDGPDGFSRRTRVLYDAAALGEGSHSHYDLLSFCLHADGRPAIVDPGRYTYSSTPDAQGVDWRHAFKGTAAHNTVTIDGADQTRYLSRTQHGPEVRIERKRWHVGAGTDWVLASARSEEYTPVHSRLFLYVLRQYLLVVDRVAISDDREHSAQLRLHLPETCRPSLHIAEDEVRLAGAPAQVHCWLPPGADASIDSGWVSREYGVKHAAPVLRVGQGGTTDLFFASAVAPRTARGRRLVLHRLRRLPEPGPTGFVVAGTLGDEPFTDTVWAPGAAFQVPGLAVAGRFAALRRDAAGAVRWVVGEGVTGLAIAGVPPRVGGGPADVEWSDWSSDERSDPAG